MKGRFGLPAMRRVAAAHRSSTQAGCRGSRPLTDTEEPVAESTCSASLASKIHCIIYHVTPPQFAARTPLHHTDSVCSGIQWLRSMYRESVGVRAPSLCGLQQSTGDVLLATVHRHTANRPTSHPHHVAIPSLSLQWNRPPLSSGIWEIPIQFAFRQMRQQPRQTRHEQQQA